MKYETIYISSQKGFEDLTTQVNEYFESAGVNVSMRNITYMVEMKAQRINPQLATPYYTALITVKNEIDLS